MSVTLPTIEVNNWAFLNLLVSAITDGNGLNGLVKEHKHERLGDEHALRIIEFDERIFFLELSDDDTMEEFEDLDDAKTAFNNRVEEVKYFNEHGEL